MSRNQTDSLFEGLFANAVVGMFVTAPKGHYIEANAALARLYGYETVQELKQSLRDIENDLYVQPNRREEFVDLLAEEGFVEDFESQVRRKDGSVIWICENARVVCDSQGEACYFEGTVIDVSHRKKVEAELTESYQQLEFRVQERTGELMLLNDELKHEIAEREKIEAAQRETLAENERLISAVTSVTSGVTITNPALPDNPIVYVNPFFLKMTGYSAEEVLNRNCRFLQGPATDCKAVAAIRTAVQERNSTTITLLNYRKDGTHFWNEFTISPVLDEHGALRYFVGVQYDVTARVEAEEALRYAKVQAELSFQEAQSAREEAEWERHEAEKSRAIAEIARSEAERANQAKSEFLSRMSHELRTPLNAILGFGQLLQEDNLQPDQTESLGHIVRAGQHLLGLITEVLDLSRIEAGHISVSIEPVSIAEVLQDSLALVRPLAARSGIALVNMLEEPDHYVLADQQRLKQVLLNLLSNAIKYNRAGGTATISCRSVGSWNNTPMLRLTVVDTGFGLTSEQQARLFVPFERVGAEKTRIEGTGLGLALCRHLMEAMGGAIGVDSVVGIGSSFWIDLHPASKDTTHEPNLETVEELNLAPAKISRVLYIEDNALNVQLLQKAFNKWPEWELLTALSGQSGYDLACSARPNVVILDVHLPDIDGAEVLRRLRINDTLRDLPVIVLSADATSHQIDRFLTLGAQAYLTKPVDFAKLHATLCNVLS